MNNKLLSKELVVYSHVDDVFSEKELWVINNSLFKAEKVISALVTPQKDHKGVDYKNYKGVEGVIDEDYRRTDIQWISVNSESEWLYKKISQASANINDKFYKFDISRIEELQYCVYKEGGHFKKHLDTVTIPNLGQRKLTVIIQLSDEEDYEGGELILHASADPVKMPKKKGSFIVFPSFILHEVTPVTKGERKVLVSWVSGINELR